MLFNSYAFIFAFLPVTLAVYFFLNQKRLVLAAKCWLVVCSLFFYSYWNMAYLSLILSSIIFNYAVGTILSHSDRDQATRPLISRKKILIFGVAANLLLLGYYKYADFFISNVNGLFGFEAALLGVALPLGISFFTFTQIRFLVDSYRMESRENNFLNYVLFVTFFPHLIAGPIVHHKNIMPQFDVIKNKAIQYKNLSAGLFLFSIGLCKKVVLADSLAVWAVDGFDKAVTLTLVQAWITSLSYSFQLYFDFSGYIDMALGSALLFNIVMPVNFDSPYQACNIQDFWRRWHITLMQFLRDYIYIPLGGNKKGDPATYRNILITFLLGGLWHGASWTFVFWGLLHGLAMVVYRLWSKWNIKLNPLIGWFITFNFVNASWVFFRAKSWADAVKVLKGMVDLRTLSFHPSLDQIKALLLISVLFPVLLFMKNSSRTMTQFRPTWKNLTWGWLVATVSLMSLSKVSEFLYFDF